MSASKYRAEGGFTVVELLVVVTLMGVIGVTFIGMVANYFVVINRTNQLSEMTVQSQNLLRSTVENIRFGDGVRQTSQLAASVDAHAPVGGWNTSNTAFVIIIPVPALTVTRDYIIDPDTGDPYMNELIYYKNGTTLMERKLAHPDAISNNMHTTCPTGFVTVSCSADIQLATTVNTMTFTLYDQDGSLTTSAPAARSVKIALNMQRNAPGNPINLTTTMQVTLRNRF